MEIVTYTEVGMWLLMQKKHKYKFFEKHLYIIYMGLRYWRSYKNCCSSILNFVVMSCEFLRLFLFISPQLGDPLECHDETK